MTKARSNAVANAAKGDLTVGSGTNLSGVLGVGSNGDTIVADTSTAVGLRWQAPVNSNPVLNSAFQVWARGTSFSFNNFAAYTADRWYGSVANTGATISRQTTSDATNLPFIQYCMRLARNSGTTNTGGILTQQSFETVNSIPYAGKTVTVSFYARAGANFSAASSNIFMYLVTGTGTDQNASNGYTGQALPVNASPTLTTTWQRFSYSATLASNVTEISTQFGYTPVGTAGAADYFEVTGVMLEVGSVATPFKTNGATIQGESSACMRYYFRLGGTNYTPYGLGSTTSSVGGLVTIFHPVILRTAATSVEYATLGFQDNSIGAPKTVTSVAIASGQGWTNATSLDVVGTGFTTSISGRLVANNSTSSYLGLSAEL